MPLVRGPYHVAGRPASRRRSPRDDRRSPPPRPRHRVPQHDDAVAIPRREFRSVERRIGRDYRRLPRAFGGGRRGAIDTKPGTVRSVAGSGVPAVATIHSAKASNPGREVAQVAQGLFQPDAQRVEQRRASAVAANRVERQASSRAPTGRAVPPRRGSSPAYRSSPTSDHNGLIGSRPSEKFFRQFRVRSLAFPEPRRTPRVAPDWAKSGLLTNRLKIATNRVIKTSFSILR